MEEQNKNHGNEEGVARALATNGDKLFVWLMTQHQRELYWFISSRVGSQADAEDVAQDLWIRVYKALGRMPPEERQRLQIRAWLFECARHLISDYYKSMQRWSKQGLTLVSIDALLDEEREIIDEMSKLPEIVIEQAEEQEELRQLLALLPENYRTIVVLRNLDKQQYDKIAEIVKQPKEEVIAIFENAMKRLRRAANHRVV